MLEIGNIKIPYQKYFPDRKLFSYNINIQTNKNGDWLVPTFQRLTNSIVIEPGLYKSKENKSTIRILSDKKNLSILDRKLKLKVNTLKR